MLAALFISSVALYSIPRTVVYAFTLIRRKSFESVNLYNRTRIITFIIVFLIHLSCFLFCFFKAGALIEEYPDSNTLLILIPFGSVSLVWLILDIYWTIAVRTYTESKSEK
jgi:small-conductance mechanosensitive channel